MQCVISAFSHVILWNEICSCSLSSRCGRDLNSHSRVLYILKSILKRFSHSHSHFCLRTRITWLRILSTTHATCMSNHIDNRDWKRKSMCCLFLSVITYQERRKGSSKLLKTLMMMLSLVTEYISGPGNCPLIRIPCIQTPEPSIQSFHPFQTTQRSIPCIFELFKDQIFKIIFQTLFLKSQPLLRSFMKQNQTEN